MKHRFFFLLLLFIFQLSAQRESLRNFRVVFYNVENFFDVFPDSIADDSEWLPGGMRGWNMTRYRQKQANIAKVITAIGGWSTPALVGLAEVESRRALIDLTRNSPLRAHGYRFIHHESPDARGIDVALLYHPFQFFPISDKAIPIRLPNTTRGTRDILYVSGTTFTGDTLHVFVTHYPSRWGGELESEVGRIFVSSVLRTQVDSLFAIYSNPNILIMGDMNDYPTNRSMLETLGAKPISNPIVERELYNLTYHLHAQGIGTYKFQGEWGMLDQIIVSGNLLNPTNGIFTLQQDVRVFDADFLLEPDDAFLGRRPFRTYIGMRYHGGFSDHLPLVVDFWY